MSLMASSVARAPKRVNYVTELALSEEIGVLNTSCGHLIET